MNKKTYKLPRKVMDKARRDFTNDKDILNPHGLNYLDRVSRGYFNSNVDMDAMAVRFDQPLDWLDGQSVYMLLVYRQLQTAVYLGSFEIPLWHIEHVLERLHREVYFVPELRNRFHELILDGWIEHRDNPEKRTYPITWWSRGDVSQAMMRNYPPEYRRYMTFIFVHQLDNAL